MSLRLKSHSSCPPNGFLYHETKTGWRSEVHVPNSQWNWSELVSAVQSHRASNPKLGLPTDRDEIERELDYVNALRVQNMRGGSTYVTSDERPPPPKSLASRLSSKLASVAAGARKVKAGALTLLDWNLSSNPPVAKELALARAEVCLTCPLNGKGDLTRWFTVPVAGQIRKAMAARSGLNLTTPHDEKLGVCEGCQCPISLKIWAPIDYISAHMPAEVKADLDPRCWIIHEMADAGH